MTDILAGRVDYLFAPTVATVAYKSRLRPLAVTSLKRASILPEVPTLAESGLPGYDMPSWRSIVGPANVPPDVVFQLNSAIVQALAASDVRDKLLTAGGEPESSSPQELSRRFADWTGRFAQIAARAGIKPR